MWDESETLNYLLERLRSAGGDTDDIEVKAAAGGLSPSLVQSICGISNLPEGGWIVLGLDERAGFLPVDLPDVAALKQGLAARARACLPPVQMTFLDAQVDGKPVVIAKVAATAASAKPCRVRSTGQAWTRAWDGDFSMSSLEEQAFLAQRSHPDFDQHPVADSRKSDLDPALLDLWADTVKALDPMGLGRFTGDELLFRAGIVVDGGRLSTAGLLTLGKHPQQFLPRFVINMSVEARENSGIRAAETTTLTGPIPIMLDGALSWARKVFSRYTATDPSGSVRDRWEYPPEAFRELVSNALVHRDLDQWSRGEAVEVRLAPTSLRVTNPGGLYGITLDRLGVRGTTSARNARLIELCRYARASGGARVVEALASGIPRIIDLMKASDLPAPRFHDNGLRFTAVLSTVLSDTGAADIADLSDSQRAVYIALVRGSQSAAELAAATGLKPPTVRKALRGLAQRGMAIQRGGRGRPTVYQRNDSA
jgi:ATP-dependent DNA helicase RecG